MENEELKQESVKETATAAQEIPTEETPAAEESPADASEEAEDGRRDKKVKAENKKLKTELAAAQKTLAETESKLAEATDKYTRLYAEYDNYRRRSQKEKEETYAAATADALTQLMPLLDNLQRAASYQEDAKLVEGLKMILSGVPEVLGKMNIVAFGEKGETFDPNFHNAVMQVTDETAEEGTIADVLQCGYRYGDKVIRHAMVSVVC